jgi:hypothetical protein
MHKAHHSSQLDHLHSYYGYLYQTLIVLSFIALLLVSNVSFAAIKNNMVRPINQCTTAVKGSLGQGDYTKLISSLASNAQAMTGDGSNTTPIPNSSSAAGSQALQAGTAILQALQNDTVDSLNLSTDIASTSALMRPDLWAILSALKASNGIENAPCELTFSEVALVWAAADHCQHGWRQSSYNFRMADRWLEQAREAYVNAHDSLANVALENLILSYYQQYAPLNPQDDSCHGQALPLTDAE